LSNWLDFYFLGGVAQLEFKTTQPDIEDLKTTYKLAYGLGFQVLYEIPNESIGIWLGCQALRAPTSGSFKMYFDVLGEQYYRRFDMTYDWYELKGFAGLSIPYKKFRFYLAGAGWYLFRKDKKVEYLSTGNIETGEIEGDYKTDVWTGGIFGIELKLPQNFALSVEALVFNEYNFHFMVGICQTGVTDGFIERNKEE
jgi:hypothetical protein